MAYDSNLGSGASDSDSDSDFSSMDGPFGCGWGSDDVQKFYMLLEFNKVCHLWPEKAKILRNLEEFMSKFAEFLPNINILLSLL